MNWKKVLPAFESLFATVKKQADEQMSQIYKDSEIKLSDKAVGAKVELVNSDSSLSTAPDGDYEMEDGTKFTVKDGLITEYNGDKGEAKVTAEETKVEAADAPVSDAPNEVADLKAQVEALKAETESIKATIEEVKAMCGKYAEAKDQSVEFSKQLETINETLKGLIKTPAEFSKTTTNNVVKDSKEEKMNDLARVFAGLNK